MGPRDFTPVGVKLVFLSSSFFLYGSYVFWNLARACLFGGVGGDLSLYHFVARP